MKILALTIIGLRILAIQLEAQTTGALPPEAERLRTKYLDNLKSLVAKYERNGASTQAAAIRSEIQKVAGVSSATASNSPAAAVGIAEKELTSDLLCSKRWVLSVPKAGWTETWTFTKEGKASGDRRHNGVWRIANGTLRFDLTTQQWSEYSIELNRENGLLFIKETRSNEGKRKDARLTTQE